MAIYIVVLSARADDSRLVGDISTGNPIVATNPPKPASFAMFSPDGKTLITIGNNGSPRIWKIRGTWKGPLRHDWTFRAGTERFGLRHYGERDFSWGSHYLVWNGAEYNIDLPQSLLILAGKSLVIILLVIFAYWLQRKANRSQSAGDQNCALHNRSVK